MLNLDDFIYEALSKQEDKESIRTALLDAKWDVKEVDAALASYADVDFSVPVPNPKPYLSARDAFIYLVLFATMYISAFNIGALFFQLINKFLPEVTRYGNDYSQDAIRFALSSIIIAFPIYVWLTLKTNKEVTEKPEKRNSRVRKWLTYLTLFITSCVVIGDLIALIYEFLSGDLTLRFVLKVLVILIISALIFSYYLAGLKQNE